MCDIFAEEIDADGGLDRGEGYVVFIFEFIIDESFYDAGFACAGISQEYDFKSPFSYSG